ncbi:putative leucine-rich repeat-containing protein DDB_G0290503 isoform X2 [Amblyraja radiata]|uniref:putative leucine-rich repeat-containing protein DDB_G0290503 isoform X2 n=1 Tax=Amblyraja radiata TaxID=386614 RepID=UPI0014029061|nr:putative leucine-rich repeat-containing protein DDB_G0290503 isoform X2 [Amblyraja radiata]
MNIYINLQQLHPMSSVEMTSRAGEDTQLKTAVGQSQVICMQPLDSFMKKSKSFANISELIGVRFKQRSNCGAYCYLQAEQVSFLQALPLVPLTKNEALLYEFGEGKLVPLHEWNPCNVDSCPPILCEPSNLSELEFDFAFMKKKEVGEETNTSSPELFSDENITNLGENIQQYILGAELNKRNRVEITEKLCLDLLLNTQKLEEENKRLLSLDANLEKRMSEISKKLFLWESNYSKHQNDIAKVEMELQDVEQDIESKDHRIGELNHTIEALWITADELADRKVELNVKIESLQNQLKGMKNQSKERDEQLAKTDKAEIPPCVS